MTDCLFCNIRDGEVRVEIGELNIAEFKEYTGWFCRPANQDDALRDPYMTGLDGDLRIRNISLRIMRGEYGEQWMFVVNSLDNATNVRACFEIERTIDLTVFQPQGALADAWSMLWFTTSDSGGCCAPREK